MEWLSIRHRSMTRPSDLHPIFRRVLEHAGTADSRSLIPTPALVCDVITLDRNIRRMADAALAAGIAFRPHVKSHKSAFIAKRQLASGASGLAFAKLSEAEVIIDRLTTTGADEHISALVTSPIVGEGAAQRAAALNHACALNVVVDHPDGVAELGDICTPDAPLSVLCDVDVGLGRTGVITHEDALRVVDAIAKNPALRFAGVQGYAGHLQHIAGRGARLDESRRSAERFQGIIDALEAAGFPVGLRTGGGTGTSYIDMELGVLNELQPGSYVFMDREYRDALAGDIEGEFEQSLTIATTVISTNQPGFVTVDAGLKAMSTDAGSPLVAGHETASLFHFFGDEQGLVTDGSDGPFPRGSRLDLIPPHCDPTVDRYEVMWLVNDDVVLDAVFVDARGCSQ